jgi:hypothetical protein
MIISGGVLCPVTRVKPLAKASAEQLARYRHLLLLLLFPFPFLPLLSLLCSSRPSEYELEYAERQRQIYEELLDLFVVFPENGDKY